MIKRKRFLTALICIILSLICAFGFAFSGCGEYKPPENGSDVPVLPDDPDEPDEPVDENENDFTVQLTIKNGKVWQNFTYDFYEASDDRNGVHEQGWIKWENIRVQWTNIDTGARHYGTLNSDGKAVYAGLDGDYKVTLTNMPTGFTYEPNINYADNISKHIEIIIYKIGSTSGVKTLYNLSDHSISYKAYLIKTTGVYRAVLENQDDRVMFAFSTDKQGTYSLTSLVDVTANMINPKLTVYMGQLSGGFVTDAFASKDDGGSENTYTKNIYWEYNISADETKGGNALIFELYSTSRDGNASYPLTVDFLLQRDGDYTRTDLSTTVQVTEDFEKTPPQPEGTFTWAKDNPVTVDNLVNSKTVILNTEEGRDADYLKSGATVEMGVQATEDDGYYYFFTYNEETNTYTLTDRVYAVVNKANDVFDLLNTQNWPVRYLLDCEDSSKAYNYTSFLATYQEHCNDDGAYPVNAELAKFLQDFCTTKKIFNDGTGDAEVLGYNADEKGMWLISCGYYQQ
ncbi:MAG: hypothetical protein ACI4MN_05490 [Candidatus Coproplasma sp.]